MTVSSETRKAGPYLGNGVTTSFPFAFKVFKREDVLATYTNANGTDIPLTLDDEYTVSMNSDQDNNPGGTVIYPRVGSPITTLAVGEKLTITGDLAYTQPTDLPNPGPYFAEVVENALDRGVIQAQQLAEILARTIKIGVSDTPLLPLPGPAARANTELGFDGTGNLTLLPLTAAIGAGDMRIDVFTAGSDFNPGTSTQLTLSREPGNQANLEIFFDGFFQGPDQWSVNGLVVTFIAPIPVGVSRVYARLGTTLSTSIPPIQSVGAAQIVNNSVGDGQLAWGGVLSRNADTIADMLALSKIIYNRCTVQSYSSGGPKFPSRYYLDPLDTTTAADGVTVFVAADGGRWKLEHVGTINAFQAGAIGDGVADDTAALARLDALINGQSMPWHVEFNAGIYCYTVSPNWAQNGVRVRFNGTVKLRYRGSGNAVILDGGAATLVQDFRFGGFGQQPIIEAHKSAGHAIFARALNTGTEVHAIVRGAGNTSGGLLTNWCVLTLFNVQVSPYEGGWYDDGTGPAKPQFGFILTERGAVNEQTSYCLFVNPVANACQFGFYVDSTLGNIFLGGDAEFNSNTNAVFTAKARNNKVLGTNFEVAGTGGIGADVTCAGYYNEFICDTGSNGVNGGFRIVGGEGNKLKGGVHDYVIVDTGAIGSYVGEITYQRSLSGNLQITDNGTKTAFGRNWAAQQQKYTYGPSSIVAVTVGASPFTYTNNTGMPQHVYVTGGTVSASVAFRGATQLGVFSSGALLSAGDSLSLTYSVLPTVVTANLT